MIKFSVSGWSASVPGVSGEAQWRAWAADPSPPQGPDTPALADVPAMQRRRIDRLGRMAIAALDACDVSPEPAEVPMVFASRHGAVAGSVELLRALGQAEPLAPTAFSLSVHNAVAALYSIVRGRRGNYIALAGGRASVEAACIEAAGLLAEGAPEVLLVSYDAPLPEVYADFVDEPQHAYAWCWRLAAAEAPGIRLSLEWDVALPTTAPESVLQHGLDLHRFLLSGAPGLVFEAEGQRWQWRRHG